MNFDPENPYEGFNIKNPNDIGKFFELETTHMPAYGYAHNADMATVRLNACYALKEFGYCGKCHPDVTFLAISYYDNFASTHEIPEVIGDDDLANLGLFLTCCFILAMKMLEPDCDITEFLMKHNSDFVTDDLDAMEHEIDRWLENRYCKRPITSLAFLDFFISELLDVDDTRAALIKNFATHRAYAQQFDIEYTEFKPSVLAATAILYSCGKFYRNEYHILASSILDYHYLDHTSLRQALKLNIPPGVANIDSETLKKVRDLVANLSNNYNSGSSPSRDDKPRVDTSSPSDLGLPVDPFADTPNPVDPFADTPNPSSDPAYDRSSFFPGRRECPDYTKSSSRWHPLFFDNEPIDVEDDNDPIGEYTSISSPTSASLFHDNEPIDDGSSSPSSHFPEYVYDDETIGAASSSSSSHLPVFDQYNQPIDSASSSSTCGSLFHDSEPIEVPAGINLDFLDWDPEDGGSIQNAVQNFGNLSGTANPQFTESGDTIKAIASEQATATAEVSGKESKHDLSSSFARLSIRSSLLPVADLGRKKRRNSF